MLFGYFSIGKKIKVRKVVRERFGCAGRAPTRMRVSVCVCGEKVLGDLSGLGCLSIRAGAIKASESGSIPSCHCDKIKAFRRPERSLPYSQPIMSHH